MDRTQRISGTIADEIYQLVIYNNITGHWESDAPLIAFELRAHNGAHKSFVITTSPIPARHYHQL